jgi:hypothetical protein
MLFLKKCAYSILRDLFFIPGFMFIPTATEKDFGVELHFSHRLINANLQEGCMTFQL